MTTSPVARHRRLAGRPGLDAILDPRAAWSARRQQARLAFLRYGNTMVEIANSLGVHCTTVSRWVRDS